MSARLEAVEDTVSVGLNVVAIVVADAVSAGEEAGAIVVANVGFAG